LDRQERLRRQTEVEALIERVSPRLLSSPGVRTLAVGLKESGGTWGDAIVLRVGVEKKRPLAEIPEDEVIPTEIEGIQTDVFEARTTRPVADTGRYRPLMGGIQVGNGTGEVGTLGCLAKRNAEDDLVILSNHHVMFAGKDATDTGIEIAQPDFSCCCCCRSGKIGVVLAGSIGGLVDCAIASIVNDVQHVQEIVDIGGVAGTDVAVVGDAVHKRGRTTELTRGTVTMVNFATTSSQGNAFTNQIFVNPDAGFTNFVEPGDSGSALMNGDDMVVGLIWGKNGNAGVANRIADVEAALSITVMANTTVSAARAPVVRMPPVGSDGVVRRRDWETMFWAERDSDNPLSRKVAAHWEEVWELIHTNREVGLRWQRSQGPAFVAAFERTTRVTSYTVPDKIAGVSFTQLLLSVTAALERHGSEGLQADIRNEAVSWIPRIQSCRTTDALWLEYQSLKQAAEAAERDWGLREAVG
jgi:hypothetical protein